MIIANVSPCQMCAQETLSTLQFASRAKHIRNKAVINQDTNGDVAMLQREVVRLRRCDIVTLGFIACSALVCSSMKVQPYRCKRLTDCLQSSSVLDLL